MNHILVCASTTSNNQRGEGSTFNIFKAPPGTSGRGGMRAIIKNNAHLPNHLSLRTITAVGLIVGQQKSYELPYIIK
jgi:hypothetical protein